MDPVDERAGLLQKAGSFYYKILAEEDIKKAHQLAHLTCSCRAFRQLSNTADAVLSGGYFEDNWKVIRFKDDQILYYGTDRALQKRYRIPYENGAAISRPGFLTIHRHFLPVVDTFRARLQYWLAFNNPENLMAQTGEGATRAVQVGGFANYSTDQEYNPDTGQKNAHYAPLTPADSFGRSHCPNNGTYELGNGVAPVNGVNFQNGFSLGIYLYNNRTSPSNCSSLMFQINDVELYVELTSSGQWVLKDSSANDVLGLNGTFLMEAGIKTWRHLGLTFKGTTMRIYVDGQLTETKELPGGSTYQLTKVRGTYAQSPPASYALYVDNLVIYSGVLREEAFKYLTTHTAPETFDVEGLSVRHKPLVMPGGDSDIVFSDNIRLVFGLLIPKDIYVTSIELDDGTMLYNGTDFQARYGLINFNENPVKVLGGMKFMARTYTERRRNLYCYTLGVDDVYGPVDRIMEYYRRNQSPKSFYKATAQAAGMPVVRVDSTVLGVMPLHGGKAYMTTSGRYDAPFPHNWLKRGDELPAGYVIGGEDLFQMYGPNDPLPEGLSGVELRDSCPVPGLTVPNQEVQLFVNGKYKPAYQGTKKAVQAYWDFLSAMPAPSGDKPATGNAMLYLLNTALANKYILVRVNEAVMPTRMQLRLQEFMQRHRPLGSVLIYAPIGRRILEKA